jgi:hypothetical protein
MQNDADTDLLLSLPAIVTRDVRFVRILAWLLVSADQKENGPSPRIWKKLIGRAEFKMKSQRRRAELYRQRT